MILKKFIILFIFVNILFNSFAFAGEKKSAGTVLEEESMVFTIKEAQEMARYISELEQKIEQKEDLLESKDLLIETKDKRFNSFEEYLEIEKQKVEKYIEIQEIDKSRISTLEKQNRTRKLENIGMFAGGVAVAVTLIIVADKLDDKVLEQVPSSTNNSARSSGLNVRF